MDKNTRERNKFGKNLSDVEKEGVNLWVNPCVDSSQKDEEEMALDSPQDSDSIDKSEDSKVKSFDLNWSGVSCISINCLYISSKFAFHIGSENFGVAEYVIRLENCVSMFGLWFYSQRASNQNTCLSSRYPTWPIGHSSA